MPSPYALKPIGHLSSSAIKDFCECEAKAAYARIFIGVSAVPTPVPIVYGIVVHKFLERLRKHWWQKVVSTGHPLGEKEGQNYIRYGLVFLKNVFAGKHGSRSETDRKVPRLLWLSDDLEVIRQEQERYLTKLWLALEAFRLEFTVMQPFTKMLFEFRFSRQRVTLRSHIDGWEFPLEGQIDRIQMAGADYVLTDFKSGWIIKTYTDRVRLVEDLQMTIYDHVARRIFGCAPKAMYIQPVDFPAKILEERGPETLVELRIPVPPRNSSHLEDVVNLGKDVRELVDFIVRPEYHSEAERQSWQPQSSYGRKAGFAESVREGRFVPRVGVWCTNCQYLECCKSDHEADWEHYRKNRGTDFPAGNGGEELTTFRLEHELVSVPGRLFADVACRPRHTPKSERVMRQEMLASGNFIPLRNWRAYQERAMDLLPGLCPCKKSKIFPLWLTDYTAKLSRGGQVDLSELGRQCPYEECPRRG